MGSTAIGASTGAVDNVGLRPARPPAAPLRSKIVVGDSFLVIAVCAVGEFTWLSQHGL
jgi:hypothetical protein